MKREKAIEIPFGAKDSELIKWEYTIPEGMEAEIKDGKVIIKKAESEDERIRKHLVSIVELYWGKTNDPDKAKELAYLEKQKEQNTIPSRETILGIWELGNFWKENPEVRDGLTQLQYIQKYWNEKCDYQKEQKPAEVDVKALLTADRLASAEMTGRLKERSEILENPEKYRLQKPADDKAFEEWIEGWWKQNKVNNPNSYDNGDEVQFDEQGFKNFCRWLRNMYQQKPTEWSEEDKNYYDTIVCTLEVIGDDSGLSNNQIKFLREHCPSHCSEWSEEDEKQIRQIERIVKDAGGSVKLQEQIHNWFKSLRPPLKDREMKLKILKYLSTRCSSLEFEEVEDYLNNLRPSWKPSSQELSALKTAVSVLTEERTFPNAAEQIQKIIDVFDGKELKKDWKPSEEQMKQLHYALTPGSAFDCDILNELYRQLRKLM